MLDTQAPEHDTSKPSRRYVANAIPNDSGAGYMAQFAFPGVVPRFVTDHNNMPFLYDTRESAEDDARRVLFEALNNRPSETSKRERYKMLSGPEFAAMVAEANLTPTFFCFLWNTTTQRFFEWVDECENKDGSKIKVPHGVRVLLAIFKDKDIGKRAIDIAESVTEEATTERKPRKKHASSA